jgi:hypothetical protein
MVRHHSRGGSLLAVPSKPTRLEEQLRSGRTRDEPAPRGWEHIDRLQITFTPERSQSPKGATFLSSPVGALLTRTEGPWCGSVSGKRRSVLTCLLSTEGATFLQPVGATSSLSSSSSTLLVRLTRFLPLSPSGRPSTRADRARGPEAERRRRPSALTVVCRHASAARAPRLRLPSSSPERGP